MENLLVPLTHTVLIEQSRDEIDAIKTAAGLTDPQFAALCMPVLRSYAEHVQALPLTPTAFSSARGAWTFGLTAAMVAYRYAGTVIFFPELLSEEKRRLEPQCKYMAFLATLASAVAMVAEAGSVTTTDDEYHPLCVDTSLFTWLSVHHRNARFGWRTPAPPLTVQAYAAIAAKFIPKGLLGSFDLSVVLMLYEAITPRTTMHGVESTLARVVREASQRVIDHHREKQLGTFQPAVAGQPISIADAQQLAKKLDSEANPKVLTNPLSGPPPTNATAPSTLSVEPASVPVPLPPPPGDAWPQEQAPPTQHAQAGEQRVAPTGDVLASANQVLREWFSALQKHENFPALAEQLEMTEEGITVPLAMLGTFGVSGPSIRKMMDEAKLIVRRSDNGRGIILIPELRSRFVAADK